jgi:hypothetical protein
MLSAGNAYCATPALHILSHILLFFFRGLDRFSVIIQTVIRHSLHRLREASVTPISD